MLTDNSNKIFSILKNSSQCLILKNGDEKWIRKSFILTQQQLKNLVKRQKIIHPNLIRLYDIEFSHCISQQKFAVEIVYQHYCKTLQECFNLSSQWEVDQIMNTFEPIIEVIEYLISEKCELKQFQFKNIVITQSQQIKYLDNFFCQKEITRVEIAQGENNFNIQKIYQKIAQKVFRALFLRQSVPAVKTWKNRMRILKQRCPIQVYTFVSSILSKSLSKGYDIQKTKKIKKSISNKKKENIEDVMNKCNRQQKSEKEVNLISCSSISQQGKNHGKQNKIQQ